MIRYYILCVVFFAAIQCQAGNEGRFDLSMTGRKVGAEKFVNRIQVFTDGLEIIKSSNHTGVILQSSSAGRFIFSISPLPKRFQAPDYDSLLLIEDDAKWKVFEQTFGLKRHGAKLQWNIQFKVNEGIPGVIVHSNLINTMDKEKAICYQLWASQAFDKYYYTESGRKECPSSLARLDVKEWVFIRKNEKGGVGLIADFSSKEFMVFCNAIHTGKGIWGIRVNNQTKPIFSKGAGSSLRFLLFFAKDQNQAKEIYKQVKEKNIFPKSSKQ